MGVSLNHPCWAVPPANQCFGWYEVGPGLNEVEDSGSGVSGDGALWGL